MNSKCVKCMYDAPHEYCCKFECMEHEFCRNCTAECINGTPLCESEGKKECKSGTK